MTHQIIKKSIRYIIIITNQQQLILKQQHLSLPSASFKTKQRKSTLLQTLL